MLWSKLVSCIVSFPRNCFLHQNIFPSFLRKGEERLSSICEYTYNTAIFAYSPNKFYEQLRLPITNKLNYFICVFSGMRRTIAAVQSHISVNFVYAMLVCMDKLRRHLRGNGTWRQNAALVICDGCNKSFADKWNLERHQQTCKPLTGETGKTHRCGKAFGRWVNVKGTERSKAYNLSRYITFQLPILLSVDNIQK